MAQKDIETFAGAQVQMSNQFGDMKEKLGDVITKNKFFIDLMKKATKQFEEWGKEIIKNKKYLMDLVKSGVGKLVDAIGGLLKTIKFFHNAWLGIKLVGVTAIHAIIIIVDELYGALRLMLTPLDMIFEGLKKIGTIEVNPFDAIGNSLNRVRASSGDVVQSVWSDIEEVNRTYDKWGNAIEKVGRMSRCITGSS